MQMRHVALVGIVLVRQFMTTLLTVNVLGPTVHIADMTEYIGVRRLATLTSVQFPLMLEPAVEQPRLIVRSNRTGSSTDVVPKIHVRRLTVVGVIGEVVPLRVEEVLNPDLVIIPHRRAMERTAPGHRRNPVTLRPVVHPTAVSTLAITVLGLDTQEIVVRVVRGHKQQRAPTRRPYALELR